MLSNVTYGILQFYKMTKQRVAFNSFDFRIYKREYFSFNLMVVAFDNLFEIVGANCVSERIDFRDGLVGLHLRRNLCRIHNNLSVEDLLFDTFVEVVGMVMDWRCWSTFPNRSESVLAVSPTTCPENTLPTVFCITLLSLSP